MLDNLHSLILDVSDILYKPWFVPLLLVAGGLYFTLRCRFMQITMFRESFRVILEKPSNEGNISSFGALMVSTTVRCLDDYAEQRRSGKNPEFKAKSIGLKEQTDFWN